MMMTMIGRSGAVLVCFRVSGNSSFVAWGGGLGILGNHPLTTKPPEGLFSPTSGVKRGNALRGASRKLT